MSADRAQLDCPSAQPDMHGARAFGVISGSARVPEVAYLKAEAVVDVSRLPPLQGLAPSHVFRIAAACEESRCAHFDGSRCMLAKRIVEQLEPAVDALPPCAIRPTCRWFAEQGAQACYRCPQVATVVPDQDLRLKLAALPITQAR